VLSCFASYKLEDVKVSQRKLERLRRVTEQSYFAKYLTSEKVCSVRRVIACQSVFGRDWSWFE